MSSPPSIRLATVLSLALAALPLRSQTTMWDSVRSGSWFDAANWTNGVPHGGSIVRLSAYRRATSIQFFRATVRPPSFA